LHIVKNPAKYGITLPPIEGELNYETISVSKQVNLKDIAIKINIPEIELKMLNPELRYDILPDDDYQLRVPPQKGEAVIATIDEIPMSCPPASPPKPAYVYHKVKSGETLKIIANRYRTSVDTIVSVNKLRSSNRIAKGRLLKIPSMGAVGYEPEKALKVYAPKKKPLTYTVKNGDSLWNLANRFGTTTKKIQALNSLSGSSLSVGQVLKIPGYSAKSLAQAQKVYIVKKGDTPNIIAKKHKMSLAQFLSLNRLTQKCKIYPGQQVFVD
jgi:membrane-bound lytic murein transglycosylase D